MSDASQPCEAKRYRAGTLSYTTFGLVQVFVWMLWGDFCFTLMEALIPSLVPLSLKMHNATNTQIGLLVGSIPAAINFILNPIISTSSDRTRSRWGRRRPYLLFTSPFVALFLILVGWGPEIGAWLADGLFQGRFPVESVVIGVIAVFAVGFQLFNMFVASVFYYIFADVVPQQFIGRFMALFRVVGTAASFVFAQFAIPHARLHMGLIFTVIALIYLVSFTLMSLEVKEGEYPPPEPSPGLLHQFRSYFRECFSISFFRWMFFGAALNNASMVCRNMFNLLFATESLGLTLKQYGHVIAVNSLIAFLLFFPIGCLVDRLHPLRMYILGGVLIIAANVFGFYFAADYASFYITMVLIGLTYVVQTASGLPMLVALYPHDRYGQFSSAGAMVSSVLLILANAGGGKFIDLFGYRYIFVWDFAFTLLATCSMLVVYWKWRKNGNRAPEVPAG